MTQNRQQDGLKGSGSSRAIVFLEEEQTWQTFQQHHFYDGKQLKMDELKRRLQMQKSKQYKSPLHKSKDSSKYETVQPPTPASPPTHSEYTQTDSPPEKVLTEASLSEPKAKSTSNKYSTASGQRERYTRMRTQQQQKQANVTTKSHSNRPMTYSQATYSRVSMAGKKMMEAKIIVHGRSQLAHLHHKLLLLWDHYQLLTQLLLGLRQPRPNLHRAINRYRQVVCSNSFEFVGEILDGLNWKEADIKRVRKCIVSSRVLEHIALVYVSVGLVMGSAVNSHLINLLGYCSSNIVFLLKVIQIVHELEPGLTYGESAASVLQTIAQFEESSYGKQITTMKDVLIRLEHNNQIMAQLQRTLCLRMPGDFQQVVGRLLRNVDYHSQPFHHYAHYIFEFLAYYLCRRKIPGLKEMEVAPAPYLTLCGGRTLVIQPWQVLFALKGGNTYMRAYTSTFLKEIYKTWNIVYWTDLLPQQIDDLLQPLPKGHTLYRYHCKPGRGEGMLKEIDRIGCDPNNTIIIDRDELNFRNDRTVGLQLRWLGKKRDGKLLTVLKLLMPLLDQDSQAVPLSSSFPALKPLILQALGSTVRRISNHRRFQSCPKRNH